MLYYTCSVLRYVIKLESNRIFMLLNNLMITGQWSDFGIEVSSYGG